MEENIYREQDFIPGNITGHLPESWSDEETAYSNIAIIKYWGKKGLQTPMNASLSLPLPQSRTFTKVYAQKCKTPSEQVLFDFKFDGENKPSFNDKIQTFFERIHKYAPYLKFYKWHFESTNNFPHSSGIASSASGFAALAKLLIKFEKKIFPRAEETFWRAKTSFIARLGSGSASRSSEDKIMVWGKHALISGSNDLYAVSFPYPVHKAFHRITDLILLLEKGAKPVSSTTGHKLVENHPFKIQRIRQAQENLTLLSNALQSGDWNLFGKIAEAEALSLHALMMTSDPPYILMNPQTLKWINLIWEKRKKKNLPLFFTLDAGANLHILYPSGQEKMLQRVFPELFEAESIKNLIEPD